MNFWQMFCLNRGYPFNERFQVYFNIEQQRNFSSEDIHQYFIHALPSQHMDEIKNYFNQLIAHHWNCQFICELNNFKDATIGVPLHREVFNQIIIESIRCENVEVFNNTLELMARSRHLKKKITYLFIY